MDLSLYELTINSWILITNINKDYRNTVTNVLLIVS